MVSLDSLSSGHPKLQLINHPTYVHSDSSSSKYEVNSDSMSTIPHVIYQPLFYIYKFTVLNLKHAPTWLV